MVKDGLTQFTNDELDKVSVSVSRFARFRRKCQI